MKVEADWIPTKPGAGGAPTPPADATTVRATIESLDGEAIVVVGPRAAPPGGRVDLVVRIGEGEADVATVRFKVHGCRKEPSGLFRLHGRTLDVPRQVRVALESMFGAGGADPH